MLRAGMVTAGQMDIDRRVERDARLAPARDLFGMAFGVGGGEFAAGIAGAGDEAGANGVGLDRETERLDRALAPAPAFRSERRRSADFARPSAADRRRRIRARSRQARASARPTSGRPARRRRSSSARPASARECRYGRCGRRLGAAPRAPGTARSSLRPSFSSSKADEFLDAHGVEHIFQPRLGAVGAIAVLDEQPHDRVGDRAGILRLHQNAGVAGEIAMAGDAAEAELEPDAGRKPKAIVHLHGLEADIVGILEQRRSCRRHRRRR